MYNSIMELRSKRAKAWEDAKNFLDTHRTENGTLSAEDNATYERMEADVVNLGKEVERMERREAMDAELARPTSTPAHINPGFRKSGIGRESNAYQDGMLAALRTNFRQISDVLVEGTDASGGYLVPAEWDRRLIEKLEEENVLRKLGTIIQTSGERKINVAASKPVGAWIEEGGALQFSDPSFSQVILDAYKLSVAVKVSEELLADNAYDLKGFLIRSFGAAIAAKEEEAFIVGDGNNKPTGILHPTYGGEIGVTTAMPTDVSVDEVLDLVYKLKRPYRAKAAFIMADSTLAAIRKMKDGNGQYIWQPALTAGEPDRLVGYPVYTSAFAPTIAAETPVMAFGDFSYYNIADRGPRTFAALNELYAANGQVAFVAKERVDGKLILPEAVQIMKTATANG